MYKFDSIIRFIIDTFLYCIFIGFGFLFESNIWHPKEKTNKLFLIISILILLFGGGKITYYVLKLNNPTIEIAEGTVEAFSEALHMSSKETYHLYLNDDNSLTLYSDSRAIKELFPNGIKQDTVYTVYYEKYTKVIVRVEMSSE